MGARIAFILGGLPLSPSAARAVAATFADWSHESGRAPHRVARLRVATRSTLALVRVLVGSASRELRGETRSPFIWRSFIACALVVVAVGFVEPIFQTQARGPWAQALMGLSQGLYFGSFFLPLAVFIAEVTGRSTRTAPSLSSAMSLAAAVLVWVAVVAPETFNFMWTIHRWDPTADAAPPIPSVVRWFNGQPTTDVSALYLFNRGLAWVCFSVSLWSLTVLAYRLRTFSAGSMRRRLAIVSGSILLAGVMIPALALLPSLAAWARGPYVRTAVIFLLAVGAFWAAAVLAHRTAARAETLAPKASRS